VAASVSTTAIRKGEIRRAAVRLFSERGYYGTGMSDIAAAVGMTASSLYNHVESKQQLLASIMLDTMNVLNRDFDEAVKCGTVSDKLRAAMEVHVRYHGTHADEARIGERELASLQQPERDQVRDLRRKYARKWQTLIQSGIDEKVFDAQSAQLSSYALFAMGVGVSQWYREGGPFTLDEIAAEYGRMALRHVGAKESHQAAAVT
jgi:AcrR family transcriptional regulator